MNWGQFAALLKIRHQLSRNQGRKAGGLNLILYDIFRILVIVASITMFFVAAIGGAIWFADAKPTGILTAWNVVIAMFTFFLLIELLQQVQQTEFVPIERLLHLPVTLEGAFFLNYVSSFNSKNIIVFAPMMIGMAVGMGIARGGLAWLALPLVLAFLFVVTTVCYQIRGWLAQLMKNKRTKSIVSVLIPLFFIAAMFLPRSFDSIKNIGAMIRHDAIAPTGWLPLDIVNADQGSWISGVLGCGAMTVLGMASLFLAFKTSLKMHRGESGSGNASKSSKQISPTAAWEKKWMFRTLPFTSEAASTVAMFNLRSLARAPEALMALLPLVALVVVGVPYLMGLNGLSLPDWLLPWLPMSVVIATMLGFPAFLFSSFSYDRDGFRAFVLSPIQRKDILLGKNWAVGLLTVISGWILLLILQILAPTGYLAFIANLLQVPITFFLLCVLGNAVSIFFPVGLKRGSMTPVNSSFIPVVVLYVTILLGPFLAIMPMNIAYGIPYVMQMLSGQSADWLYLTLTLIQFIVIGSGYVWSLGDLGRWLWEREPKILEIVAHIPE